MEEPKHTLKAENTRLKSELLHRDVTVLPQKDLEFEEMKASLQSEIDCLKTELSEMKKEREELVNHIEWNISSIKNSTASREAQITLQVYEQLLNRIKK